MPDDDHDSPETEPTQRLVPPEEGHDTGRTEILSGRPAAASGDGAGPPQVEGRGYRLRTILGEGGMATVYEAHDVALARSVAVKVLKPDLAADGEQRARFFYEAHILGQLEHPGVLPVFTAGSLEGHGSYYAMKKVAGRTLRQILKDEFRHGPPDAQRQAELFRIFETICQTVAYAHAQGIVHRDLKPENIMVDDFGVVLVMDWGLSKRVDQAARPQDITATQPGVVKGTPAYMSPEQASGAVSEVDYRTDVFSLGIILYQILTGCLPFSGDSHFKVLEQIRTRDPDPPRKVNRRASRVLAAVCMKALNKDPSQRYPTARELADDFRRAESHLTTSAYAPGPFDLLGNWVWRNTVLAAALGTALVLLLAFAGVLWHRSVAQGIRRTARREQERALVDAKKKEAEENLRGKMLDSHKTMNAIRDLDDKITALKGQRRAEADPSRRKQLDLQIQELHTVRLELSTRCRSSVTMIFSQLLADTDGNIREADPEVFAFMRGLFLAQVETLVEHKQYFEAHLRLHLTFWWNENTDNAIGWPDDKLAKLRALKEHVEAELRKAGGPAFQLPDWKALEPTRRPRPTTNN